MSTDRLITLAIHTYDKAIALKTILEREGIVVSLNNVNISQPAVSSGIRVRICEKDLPLALRIVENPDIFNKKSIGNNENIPIIIVPIDFSDYSYRACLMAFNLAKLHKAKIEIIHSYIDPYSINKFQFGDHNLDIDEVSSKNKSQAEEQIIHFSNRLIEQIKFGIIPPIKFSTSIVEGVPEDSITEYAKQMKPRLIVMGTRGIGKKEKDLIGSVTGEVLDSCRFPVFVVPESANIYNVESIRHILFFSNIEHEDIIALDALYRLLPNISINVTIVNVPHKTFNVVDSFLSLGDNIIDYCTKTYPRFNFNLKSLSLDNLSLEFSKIEKSEHIDLIVVPNKKKNVFARFFNPSLAHKILLHADIPMMTIPL